MGQFFSRFFCFSAFLMNFEEIMITILYPKEYIIWQTYVQNVSYDTKYYIITDLSHNIKYNTKSITQNFTWKLLDTKFCVMMFMLYDTISMTLKLFLSYDTIIYVIEYDTKICVQHFSCKILCYINVITQSMIYSVASHL